VGEAAEVDLGDAVDDERHVEGELREAHLTGYLP
jgi:hypothetical protein